MRLFLVIAFCLTLRTAAWADLRIVTTTTDFADLARQVGGDKVTVHSVMKGPEDIHNVVAKPTEMIVLNRADLFVHSGVDAEPWRDNLLKGARNPRVASGREGNVDMSAGIELRDVPVGRVDRSMGDVHAFGNPHYTLNPINVQRMIATLTKAMVRADPANAEFYKKNAARSVSEFAELTRELKRQLEPYAGLKVVTFHAGAWDYFASVFPMEIIGTIEPKPSITPSPGQVRSILQSMKDQRVKLVIASSYNDEKLARSICEQAEATLLILPEHVAAAPEADTVQNLFRYNVTKIIEAVQAAGIAPKPSPSTETSQNAR